MIYFVLNILPSVVCFDDALNFSNNKKKNPSKHSKKQIPETIFIWVKIYKFLHELCISF